MNTTTTSTASLPASPCQVFLQKTKASPPTLIVCLFVTLLGAAFCKGQNNTMLARLEKTVATGAMVVKPDSVSPYTSIRCSLQDRWGNLWFGTTGAGLYCYNGKRFIHYTEKDGLCHNMVYSLLQDGAGNIWVGTGNGISVFNGKTFMKVTIPGMEVARIDFLRVGFSMMYSKPGPTYSDRTSVFSMLQDKAGNIWLGTGMGLYCYNSLSFTNYKYSQGRWRSIPKDSVGYYDCNNRSIIQTLLQDRAGNIWFNSVGVANGIYRLNPRALFGQGSNAFTSISSDARLKNLTGDMLEDRDGNIWLNTQNQGVGRYDGKTVSFFSEKQGMGHHFVSAMLQDKKGTIWLAGSYTDKMGRTNDFLTRYDGKSFTQFPLGALGNTSIWSLLEDKAGNIWIGTRNMGLYKYDGKSIIDFTDNDPGKVKKAGDGC